MRFRLVHLFLGWSLMCSAIFGVVMRCVVQLSGRHAYLTTQHFLAGFVFAASFARHDRVQGFVGLYFRAVHPNTLS